MSKFRNEIVLTIILLSIATAIIFFAYGAPETKYYDLLSKFGFAIMIGVIGRWIVLLFFYVEKKSDIYSSSRAEYRKAIENATKSIDVLQTWFPEHQIFTHLLEKKINLKQRILLSSIQEGSHIHSRIKDRQDINTVEDVMHEIRTCISPLIKKGKQANFKFNFGHHPGWITIIDKNLVFWGPTPSQTDNNAEDFFFHKDSTKGVWGAFWVKEFDNLWKSKFCHDYETEMDLYSKLEKSKKN